MLAILPLVISRFRFDDRSMSMFAVFCEGHGARVLLDSGLIETLHNGSAGIEVHYRCTCGHRGVWVAGGGARVCTP